jgi:hypothetical protein
MDERHIQLGKAGDAHLYRAEVCRKAPSGPAQWLVVEISADNRTRAQQIAERAGYVVNSMNMIG